MAITTVEQTPTYEIRGNQLWETTPFAYTARVAQRDPQTGELTGEYETITAAAGAPHRIADRTSETASWTFDAEVTQYQKNYLEDQGVASYSLGGQRFDMVSGAFTAVNAEGVPMPQAALEATATERAGILESMRGGYREAIETLRGAGQQEAADIRQTFSETAARGRQELVSRGFAGTTVLPSIQAGVARQQTAAQGRLGERLRGEKLGLMTGLRQQIYGFRERGVLTPGQALNYSVAAGATGQGAQSFF